MRTSAPRLNLSVADSRAPGYTEKVPETAVLLPIATSPLHGKQNRPYAGSGGRSCDDSGPTSFRDRPSSCRAHPKPPAAWSGAARLLQCVFGLKTIFDLLDVFIDLCQRSASNCALMAFSSSSSAAGPPNLSTHLGDLSLERPTHGVSLARSTHSQTGDLSLARPTQSHLARLVTPSGRRSRIWGTYRWSGPRKDISAMLVAGAAYAPRPRSSLPSHADRDIRFTADRDHHVGIPSRLQPAAAALGARFAPSDFSTAHAAYGFVASGLGWERCLSSDL